MDEHAFENLKISDYNFLFLLDTRNRCRNCGKSRMYYCYTCFLPLTTLESLIPKVELPFNINIIKHPGEVCGKSTAIHAAILAPDHVTINIYPNIPKYDPSKTILIFPDKTAKTLKEFFKERKINKFNTNHVNNYSNILRSTQLSNNLDDVQINKFVTCVNNDTNHVHDKNIYGSTYSHLAIETVVFIDCTWLQTFKIITDQKLEGIPRIKLDDYETRFWRYQRGKPSTYLSTIEAIYYLTREFDENVGRSDNDGGNSGGEDIGDDYRVADGDRNYADDRNGGVDSGDIDNMGGNKFSENYSTRNSNNEDGGGNFTISADNKEVLGTDKKNLIAIIDISNDSDSCSDEKNKNFNCKAVEADLHTSYQGQYDDLLYFFIFFYEKIAREATNKGRVLKSYKQRCEYKSRMNGEREVDAGELG